MNRGNASSLTIMLAGLIMFGLPPNCTADFSWNNSEEFYVSEPGYNLTLAISNINFTSGELLYSLNNSNSWTGLGQGLATSATASDLGSSFYLNFEFDSNGRILQLDNPNDAFFQIGPAGNTVEVWWNTSGRSNFAATGPTSVDLATTVAMETGSPAPIPNSAALLGLALLSFIGFGLRRRKNFY